jgi:tRNA C32,U32 (ribose-2'-O)-methylase TrmJ
MNDQITIDDKYTITNDNGVVMIYCYGELWKEVTKFDLCMFQELKAKERALRDLYRMYRDVSKGREEIAMELMKEREDSKHLREAFEQAKLEAQDEGAQRIDEDIPDDKEEAYRYGADDMFTDFLDFYEQAIKGGAK